MPRPGPTVVRRQLGRRLRQLRISANVTPQEVDAQRQLGISRAKLYKLEAGKHVAKPQDVNVLCRFYNASEREIETLTALAVATREASWWHVYGRDAVPEWFSLYVDLEPAATRFYTYESELVPGLLQTSDYATAVYKARNPDTAENDLERRIAVRMERQAILHRENPLQLHVVLNESVLLRQVGNSDVMRAQLQKLRTMSDQSHITIKVLPFSSGAHAAMENTFVIMEFPDASEDPPVVYIDTSSSAAYLHEEIELDRYSSIFQQINNQATPLKEYAE